MHVWFQPFLWHFQTMHVFIHICLLCKHVCKFVCRNWTWCFQQISAAFAFKDCFNSMSVHALDDEPWCTIIMMNPTSMRRSYVISWPILVHSLALSGALGLHSKKTSQRRKGGSPVALIIYIFGLLIHIWINLYKFSFPRRDNYMMNYIYMYRYGFIFVFHELVSQDWFGKWFALFLQLVERNARTNACTPGH